MSGISSNSTRTLITALAIALTSVIPCNAASSITGTFPFNSLMFEENIGHMENSTQFVAKGRQFAAYFMGNQVRILLPGNSGDQPLQAIPAVLTIELPNLPKNARIIGEERIPLQISSFVGDRSKWRTNIPAYKRVRWENVSKNIDMVFMEDGAGMLRFDYHVKPGGNHNDIAFSILGADEITKSEEGNLQIMIRDRQIRLSSPKSFLLGGEEDGISSTYQLSRKAERYMVSFDVGAYGKDKTLVIDPTLNYSLFIGGPNTDIGIGASHDGSDLAVCGYTFSNNFPHITTVGTLSGVSDAFVALTGRLLYYGGSGSEEARDIRLTSNSVYVVGWTNSGNLPLVNQLLPHRGGKDAFIASFSRNLSTIYFSTYLGGASDDIAYGMDYGSNGQIYVTGTTNSYNFPVTGSTPPYQSARAGDWDAFVARITTSGGFNYAYGTYFGGSSLDQAFSIRSDLSGNCYIVGGTESTNLPVLAAFQGTKSSGRDGFITKISGCGTSLSFSTYFGGTGFDALYHVARSNAGDIYVAGETDSFGLATSGAFQTLKSGGRDVYLAKMTSLGVKNWSTYLGGSGDEAPGGMEVESASGNPWVSGGTNSGNFPVSTFGNALSSVYNGGTSDGFLARFSTNGTRLFSGFMGGSSSDRLEKISIPPNIGGSPAFMTGWSSSWDFPSSDPGGKSGGTDGLAIWVTP